ncbi:DUF547 domain-containing protein [Zeaxanthinibacter sp. PT1]|uniref:DUF547 domain-containing protein n=1 Tax=Zeaxanthinibacter TaxID=561554 RepID=UPI00234954C7|nr:DUF547 domain-containing protein [Zeaxanthinibacter sp. PT1]MDC6351210.1 DUF547 domain-containing protein [Zeaxanthinibacter sp. PT1]
MNLIISLFLFIAMSANPVLNPFSVLKANETEQEDDLHMSWQYLLNNYVNAEGNVNYAGMKKEIAVLDTYLKVLAENAPLDESTQEEKLSYYINLYNAATVKLILDNYPLKSIKDLRDPWNRKWISIGDKKVSLAHIENEVLRKMDEPRIHFAINCASLSCPALARDAFRPGTMEKQLQEATLSFIRDSQYNSIQSEKLNISRIFDWYKEDFTNNGSLIDYLNRYSKVEINDKATVSYKDYNWKLNDSN